MLDLEPVFINPGAKAQATRWLRQPLPAFAGKVRLLWQVTLLCPIMCSGFNWMVRCAIISNTESTSSFSLGNTFFFLTGLPTSNSQNTTANLGRDSLLCFADAHLWQDSDAQNGTACRTADFTAARQRAARHVESEQSRAARTGTERDEGVVGLAGADVNWYALVPGLVDKRSTVNNQPERA